MKPLIFTLALLPLTASAQRFTVGVQAGVPTQTDFRQTTNMPFLLGPSVGIRIFSGLSLETGLMYRRIGTENDSFAFLFPENAVTLGYRTRRGSALEIPVLAKYRLFGDESVWRPFLTAGATVRRTSVTTDTAWSVLLGDPLSTGPNPPFVTSRRKQWNADPTVGVGVDLRVGRIHVEPEARYSYWGAGANTGIRKNQVNLLFGLRF